MELNIYQYKNYRDFLKDFYVGKKKFNPRYSYAVFSQKSGLASPNYLKRVMDGTRNITHNNLRNFIVGLSLAKKEATYFENLVQFNQTEQKEVKAFYFGELSKVSKNKDDSAFKIDAQFYEYLSHWFYVAIHELVNLSDFKEDLDWICAALKNKITKPQAKKALELLITMGFLKRTAQGRLIQVYPKLEYLQEVKNLAIQKFHQQMLDLAKESIAQEEIYERDPSSLTVCVKEKDYESIKKRIEEFRDELNSKFSCQPGEGKEVLQLNFQLFSLTTKRRPS
ncbi:MAG: TIGR02147 family protein [Deltaproteobacteria bacterium]|nr:TIGR02147 family protein [Deltaproteobacteria bacterium]